MEGIVVAAIGIACIIIGIFNRMGNVSMLHSYHRKRVSEEDKIPFGKLVGLGMIIIGASMILAGGLSIIGTVLEKNIYEIISYIIVGVGLVVGSCLMFYAMFKYNKGIF